MMSKFYKLLYIPLFFLVMVGCRKKENKGEKNPAVTDELKTGVLENYASIVYQSYQDSYDKAVVLQQAINSFVASPSATTLQTTKDAWLDAREPYGQTEVYRFYEGPIDAEGGPEGDLNAWPLDESFIDYTRDDATSGIINDLTVTIDATTLRSKNEEDGVETNVSIGYHAIEFLLWGQDDADASLKTSGSRSFTDYTTAANADRRGEYLKVCATLLVEDLQTLTEAWKSGDDSNYRASFVTGGDASLSSILTGMGSLSKAELGGERMKVALANHDQEDEHSCFSDNTHRDIVTNAQGIQNVYLGTYSTVNGLGITDLIEALDSELNVSLKTAFTTTMTAMEAIDANKPFDYEISSANTAGNERVQAAIDALEAQTTLLEKAASLLALSINTDG